MRCPPRQRSCAGFTLVEALIATVLMGIILAALATVTAQWLPNWNRGFARVQRVELLAAGLERLVADLSAAEIVPAGSAGGLPVFDGSELSVTFVRTAIGPNALPGLQIVRIAETTGEQGPAMVRMNAPLLPDDAETRRDQPAFADPVVVVRSPYRVTFSYAGRDRVWRDTWRGAAEIPRAIRVSVRDAGTSRTLPVSTSTVIHAEIPARCASAKLPADCPELTSISSRGPVGASEGQAR